MHGEEESSGVFSLRFFAKFRDDQTEIIDAFRSSLCSCAFVERGEVSTCHHPLEDSDFEEVEPLLLSSNLLTNRSCRLWPPCCTQHTVTVEVRDAAE